MNVKLAETKYGIRKGVHLNHPMFGIGEVSNILSEGLELRWTNPYHRINSPKMIPESEITFMTKVITEENKMKQNKKVVLEFDLPNPKDTIMTSTDPMSKGNAAPLATLDGDGGPGVNWKPSMSSDPKDAPGVVKVAGSGDGKVGVPKAKSSAPAGGEKAQPKSNPFEKKSESSSSDDKPKGNPFGKKEDSGDDDNKEKRVAEMQLTWEDISSLLSEKKDDKGEKDKRADRLANKDKDKKKFDKKDDLDECEGDKDEKEVKEGFGDEMGGAEQALPEHDMASGEIAVTPELLKAILQTAVKDQPDDSAIDKIVSGFSGCCGGDRTLDVSDIGEIMASIKGDSAGGADMSAEEDIAPADGETAGAEGGAEHEGKDMLMQGQKQPLGKMSGKPGQKWPNAIKPSYVEGKKAPKGKKINEAWLTAIPNAGVASGERFIATETDDEDTQFLKEIAHRAGVEYKG